MATPDSQVNKYTSIPFNNCPLIRSPLFTISMGLVFLSPCLFLCPYSFLYSTALFSFHFITPSLHSLYSLSPFSPTLLHYSSFSYSLSSRSPPSIPLSDWHPYPYPFLFPYLITRTHFHFLFYSFRGSTVPFLFSSCYSCMSTCEQQQLKEVFRPFTSLYLLLPLLFSSPHLPLPVS